MDSGTAYWMALAGSIILNLYLIRAILQRAKATQSYKASACHKCGYDVRFTTDGKCPECGEPITAPTYDPQQVTQCSFCGKSNRQTGPQVIGPDGAFICAPCVELCYGVILKNREKAQK